MVKDYVSVSERVGVSVKKSGKVAGSVRACVGIMAAWAAVWLFMALGELLK